MFRYGITLGKWSWRLASIGLTAEMLLACTNLSTAQESQAPPAAITVLPVIQRAQQTPVPVEAKQSDGVAAPVEEIISDEAPKPPPPFWTTVPHLSPPPKTGNFFIPASGPGYYSLRDAIVGEERQTAPKNPWPPISPDPFSFYDADFRYLDNPNNTQFDWLDPIKRIHPNENWLISLGGEERLQYKNETDNGIRMNGKNNTYELNRVRLYGDVWYKDIFRIYAEYIDASSYNQDLPSLPIDVNHSDFLNLFIDLKLFEFRDHPLYARVGRQEMTYGSQRLISPLDWANTRRTFEGAKTFWHGEKFDVDAFWVKPVLISPSHFDAADANRGFAGLWTTYRPKKGQAIDVYYLYLDQTNQLAPKLPVTGRGGQNVNTIGSRYAGNQGNFLWDFEGMAQFGTIINNSISAGAATAGVGYRLADVPMTPTVWIYNDYASGDSSGGKGGTFNQLFPFGHFYFGFIDAVGRQNIEDLNVHLTIAPTNWIVTGLQGHFMYLDSGKDALYNAAGTATRKDPTGKSGLHVGNEIDWTTNFHLTTHQDVLIGYSQLFAGEFIKSAPLVSTGKVVNPGSPALLYVQYSFKW